MTVVAAVTSTTWLWYFTRATGLVALILLSGVLVLGILGPLRTSSRRWPRFAIETVHRDLSLLAVVLIVVHVLTTVLDGYAPIGLLDAIVPFASAYRPIWLGLGAMSLDLMLAIVLTSLVRRWLGHRAWRFVHWLAYASWPLAVVHGIGTGSDSGQGWAIAVTAVCVAVVAGSVLVRLARATGLSLGARNAGIAVALSAVVGFGVLTVVGPLTPHWAARAGTPTYLISRSDR